MCHWWLCKTKRELSQAMSTDFKSVRQSCQKSEGVCCTLWSMVREVQYLKSQVTALLLIYCCDFNCSCSGEVPSVDICLSKSEYIFTTG